MKRYNLVIIFLFLFLLPFHVLLAKPTHKQQQEFDNRLNNLLSKSLVCFEKGRYEINDKNISIINEIAVMLKSECFRKKTLAIHGHTDTTGEAHGYNNQKLSENRARAVYDYLLTKCNVSPDRIAEVVGWGITKPVEQGAYLDSLNRSVQFFVDHNGEAYKFDNLIPVDYQHKMQESGLTINRGNNPPKIEGMFELSSNELVFTSDDKFPAGKIFANNSISFRYELSDDNQIIIRYESICGKTIKTSNDVRVIGEGDKFTAYFVAEGTKDDIFSKSATIISGEKTKDGIKNLNMSFVILEKSNDGFNKLMKIGDYRIFKDSDDLSSTR
jgi:hypothetical protein